MQIELRQVTLPVAITFFAIASLAVHPFRSVVETRDESAIESIAAEGDLDLVVESGDETVLDISVELWGEEHPFTIRLQKLGAHRANELQGCANTNVPANDNLDDHPELPEFLAHLPQRNFLAGLSLGSTGTPIMVSPLHTKTLAEAQKALFRAMAKETVRELQARQAEAGNASPDCAKSGLFQEVLASKLQEAAASEEVRLFGKSQPKTSNAQKCEEIKREANRLIEISDTNSRFRGDQLMREMQERVQRRSYEFRTTTNIYPWEMNRIMAEDALRHRRAQKSLSDAETGDDQESSASDDSSDATPRF